MLQITSYLNQVNHYLSGGQKRCLAVGQTEGGLWLVADDELEIAAFIVIHHMIKNKYERLGPLTIIQNNLSYCLVNSDYY